MHLLPHKSWNVWSQKNIEKVRRDEEKHRLEEEAKLKRKDEIEQEKRYAELKNRAKRKRNDNDSNQEPLIEGTQTIYTKEGHINFFQSFEENGPPIQKTEGNPEYIAEKKKMEDRFTNYLAPPSAAAPWYSKHGRNTSESETIVNEEKRRKMEKRKEKADPLNDMKWYLDQTKKVNQQKKVEEKKAQQKKSIEDLRKERLAREQMERQKIESILHPNVPSKSSHPPPHSYSSTYASAISQTKQNSGESSSYSSVRFTEERGYQERRSGTSESRRYDSHHNRH